MLQDGEQLVPEKHVLRLRFLGSSLKTLHLYCFITQRQRDTDLLLHMLDIRRLWWLAFNLAPRHDDRSAHS